MGTGALEADNVFASTMLTEYSTLDSAINVGSNHAAVTHLTGDMTHLHATPSTNVENNTLQGVVGSSVNMSAGS
jgi:hypothetical protein